MTKIFIDFGVGCSISIFFVGKQQKYKFFSYKDTGVEEKILFLFVEN